jgi:hypothetical protein
MTTITNDDFRVAIGAPTILIRIQILIGIQTFKNANALYRNNLCDGQGHQELKINWPGGRRK